MSRKTALADPRSMQWHDVEADGDAREDKAWRELMGDDGQADRSVRDIVAAELGAIVRKFDPHQPRDPSGKWSVIGAAKHAAEKLIAGADDSPRTGSDALDIPPVNLAHMGSDPRAASLWYRTGDNSLDTPDGHPGFVGLNDYMRNGRDDPAMKRRVDDIDSVMRESLLPHAILVHRGIEQFTIGEPGTLTGTSFQDKAFVSTTTSSEWARTFGGSMLNIQVPAGTAAIRMADRDPNDAEAEILLDRDLTFRVMGERVTRDDLGRISSHEIDVQVVR